MMEALREEAAERPVADELFVHELLPETGSDFPKRELSTVDIFKKTVLTT